MLGVAFSGGGIRSAAVCSGVLRRLLKQGAEPDYLSCVSGGGYTGSAYVDWKYRHKGKGEGWKATFFNNMRDRAGLFCNWHSHSCEGFNNIACRCVNGCWDSLVLFFLICIVIGLSILIWGSFAFPIAFLVKFLYGHFLDGELCRKSPDHDDCSERTLLFAISAGIFVFIHLISYFIKRSGCETQENYLKIRAIKNFSKLGQIMSGTTFAFTFIPWFLDIYLTHIHFGFQIVVLLVTASFWLFVPILRVYSSLVLLIYSYSCVVYWHLYEEVIFGLSYTEERFLNILGISLCIIAVASILGDFHLRLVHIYNRWRLQKAFYYFNNESCCRCAGIGCYDWFPGSHMYGKCLCACPPETRDRDAQQRIPMRQFEDYMPETGSQSTKFTEQNVGRALTLGDLKGEKPVYISNVVGNGWRKNERNYCHIALSPEGISVIDKQPQSTSDQRNQQQVDHESLCSEGFEKKCFQDEKFEGKLTPNDIKLSSAMAMSAAAVSPYLGKLEKTQRKFTHALSIFGVDMAARIVYDMSKERDENICRRKASHCSHFLNGLLFTGILSLGVYLIVCKKSPAPILPITTTLIIVLVLISTLLLVILSIGCCASGQCEVPEDLGSCSRWMQVHIPAFKCLRSMLNVITVGDTPPAILHLSDGGHFENYGVLPLLRLRLSHILVVDGGQPADDENYGDEIITAMEHARVTLGCSFTAMDGGDVLADIKEKYEKTEDGQCPRKYEFRVQYYDTDNNGVRHKVGEGHIVLLVPRHPKKGQKSTTPVVQTQPGSSQQDAGRQPAEQNTPKTWKDFGESLSADWGEGPFLEESDVDAIAGCTAGCGCCECCESCTLSCCRDRCKESLSFPRHTTALQFFTPKIFTAYHREGYRAAIECDEFLRNAVNATKSAVSERESAENERESAGNEREHAENERKGTLTSKCV